MAHRQPRAHRRPRGGGGGHSASRRGSRQRRGGVRRRRRRPGRGRQRDRRAAALHPRGRVPAGSRRRRRAALRARAGGRRHGEPGAGRAAHAARRPLGARHLPAIAGAGADAARSHADSPARLVAHRGARLRRPHHDPQRGRRAPGRRRGRVHAARRRDHRAGHAPQSRVAFQGPAAPAAGLARGGADDSALARRRARTPGR